MINLKFNHVVHFWNVISTIKSASNVPFRVVYRIPKPRSVHNGELQLDAFLFYIHCVLGDFYSLRDSLYRGDTKGPLKYRCLANKTENIDLRSQAGPSLPSALSNFLSLYRSVRKRLLTRVDFPRPDSPSNKEQQARCKTLHIKDCHRSKYVLMCKRGFTCNHEREVKPLLDWLAVHLIRQCCKTHIFLVLVLKKMHTKKKSWLIGQSKHSQEFPMKGVTAE